MKSTLSPFMILCWLLLTVVLIMHLLSLMGKIQVNVPKAIAAGRI